jgi:hypothetical protein
METEAETAALLSLGFRRSKCGKIGVPGREANSLASPILEPAFMGGTSLPLTPLCCVHFLLGDMDEAFSIKTLSTHRIVFFVAAAEVS